MLGLGKDLAKRSRYHKTEEIHKESLRSCAFLSGCTVVVCGAVLSRKRLHESFWNASLAVKNKKNKMNEKPCQLPNLKTLISVFTIFKKSIFEGGKQNGGLLLTKT